MSKVCSICERTALKGNNRSHSNIATRRRQHLNLQKTKIDGRSAMVCTSCLKTQSKKSK
ncbi:50S ribosomal protein L28 [Patescibacteria group bacterium]|nr:50S ribosomal protein L28 [Patescibacteria group bacterium]